MALVNLIDNAVKYSPERSAIFVIVEAVASTATGVPSMRVSVADQGPGIPEVMRERVFDRFYRLDKSRNSDAGGVGLGLAITKLAVEVHHGEVGVHQLRDAGALFYIVLPVST